MGSLISIIIPCRNEEKFIAKCLDSVLEFECDREFEVLIVDGMSDDATRNIVKEYQNRFPQIRLLENRQKTVPYAMNIGIKEAKGDIIVRLDAHAKFPKDYLKQLLFWKEKLNADNVGGVVKTLPPNNTAKAKAIALALSSPFGVGNSYFRVGAKEPMRVDTVPFGCYDKDTLLKLGLYDTDLTRNQDDELNARLIQNGKKIWLIPNIVIDYYARSSFKALFKMFYQYGYFKPLVNKKLKHPATIRQFVPLIFVLFIFIGLISIFFSKIALKLYLAGLSFYFALSAFFGFKLAKKEKNLKLVPYLLFSFFIIHFAYGLGYLKGILDFIVLNKVKKDISLSR